MRRIIFMFVMLLVWSACIKAQDESDIDGIFISVVQPDMEDMPDEAGKQLQQKLEQLLMQNGIASTDSSNRFVLTTKVSVLTKDIVPGPPSKVSMKVDFTFIVGDAEENKMFESATVSSVGVGINENKAFIAATKSVKPKMAELAEMLDHAKQKIVEYYRTRCPQIIDDAKKEAAAHNYEAAMCLLVKIPNMCDCAEESQNLLIKCNKEFIDNRAMQQLNSAKAAWAASPNSKGASEAADIIAKIPANTSCQSGINALTKQITSKLQADQSQAW